WCTPLIGIVSGLLGGVSSFLGPLMAMYLVGLRVTKDQFVGAIALFYLIAAIPFFSGLAVSGHFGWRELLASTAAAFLIWLGVLVGQRLRARASAELFRRLVLVLLMIIGANMVRKGLT
ncbi:MAG: TSUP family transporter, partial [Geminicoccales bacterium]